jgi:hypothetical protein
MYESCITCEEIKIYIKCKSEDMKRKNCLGELSIDVRIILKGMFKKQCDVRMKTYFKFQIP